ncbi:MAG: alpha/beta fold hydrolase [Leucobacter sp.]
MNDRLSHHIHSTSSGDAAASPEHQVVFLHGLFGRGRNFSRIASGLQPEAQSLLVDLPNHGQSEWTASLDYFEIADLVADHLREGFASAGPVDVVGHSMGGKVAMILALRHPDLVRRLVVVDVSPTAADSARGEFQHLLDSLAGLDLAALESRGDADTKLRDAIPQHTVRGFLLQNLKRSDGGFRWEPNLELLRAELETIMGFPEISNAPFTEPVLWIGGELSNYVTDADEPAMRALFPKTVRMTVRDAGHWVHSQQPDAVIGALRTFLLTDS